MAEKFRCPACGAEFDTQEQLQQHARQHHQGAQGQQGQASFRCPACGAEFTTREQLDAHAKQAHAMQP